MIAEIDPLTVAILPIAAVFILILAIGAFHLGRRSRERDVLAAKDRGIRSGWNLGRRSIDPHEDAPLRMPRARIFYRYSHSSSRRT